MNKDELRLKTDKKLSFKTLVTRNVKYVKPELFKIIISFFISSFIFALAAFPSKIIKTSLNSFF